MIYSVPMQTATCTKCRECKAASDFFMDNRLGKRRTVCKACFRLANRRRTPQQRARYRRKYGNVAGEYVPFAAHHERRASFNAERERKRAVRALARTQPKYDAHVKAWKSHRKAIEFAARYTTDPQFAAKERLRNQIKRKMKLYPRLDDLLRAAVKRNGASSIIESACGFTIAEFVHHFERLFTQGMSWDAFRRGDIHIDHIVPQSVFDMNDLTQVRACWALENLQPLWAKENLAKSDRVNGISIRSRRRSCMRLPGPSDGVVASRALRARDARLGSGV